MLNKKALSATAGAPKVFVEDVMSCFLYTGNGSTQTITNNIDLSGEGGLVWCKFRNDSVQHALYDTVRGVQKELNSAGTGAEITRTNGLTSFSSTGFVLGSDSVVNQGSAPNNYVSWTFRKAEKFFDVVTYTGNGTAGRTVSHNLGSVPGAIFVKQTSASGESWVVYHQALGNTKVIYLDLTDAATNGSTWNNTTPTSTVFTVGGGNSSNQNGATYVAYLFAHDAGGFGDAGDQNVITCGSYTGTGSAQTLSLGYEPQWVLIKQSSGANDWNIWDNMRGLVVGGTDAYLQPNTSNAENSLGAYDFLSPTATGLTIDPTSAGFNYVNTNGQTYIYIAIRRGPMKTPTTGTSVFSTGLGSSSTTATYTSGFVTDAALALSRPDDGSGYGRNIYSRLQGNFRSIATNTTNSEATATDNTTISFTQNDGIKTNGGGVYNANWVYEQFRRAPKFFDVVCYTGNGGSKVIDHNLTVTPQMIIMKRRNAAGDWGVYFNDDVTEAALLLNSSAAKYGAGVAFGISSTTFTVYNTDFPMSNSINGATYVSYLFASLSGVSKIGTYTGNGSSVTVTTNFQPRFILVKRTDSTGDWIVSDSARGLVAGNDPYLDLNNGDAEVTNEDWVDISSTSFTVNQTTNNANVNTGTYLYLAIA